MFEAQVQKVISRNEWLALVSSQSGPNKDKISVKNLSVEINAGRDAWGRQRSQPCLLSATLHLSKPFDCKDDDLDNTTVHYGVLSKNLRKLCVTESPFSSSDDLARQVGRCIVSTAGKTELECVEVDIFYPKASLLGDGQGYWLSECHYDGAVSNQESRIVYVRNVRIPCIIGMNDNERWAKQPVVVNAWLDGVKFEDVDRVPLEKTITEVIADSDFETLEAMAAKLVAEVSKYCGPMLQGNACLRLTLEKPLAVPFADAPCVEVVRQIHT